MTVSDLIEKPARGHCRVAPIDPADQQHNMLGAKWALVIDNSQGIEPYEPTADEISAAMKRHEMRNVLAE